MIIPIKCVSCGNVIANKYRYYLEKVRQRKIASNQQIDKVIYFTKDMESTSTHEADVMNELRLTNMCCRRIFLTHVDVE
jgi:DNA-directed RNA polymerase I, II, and III subunit RPABC5